MKLLLVAVSWQIASDSDRYEHGEEFYKVPD